MIKLIVGLGNPGKNYQEHRHNAGFWFVESLASIRRWRRRSSWWIWRLK